MRRWVHVCEREGSGKTGSSGSICSLSVLEREGAERERESVCVRVWEIEKERESERDTERETATERQCVWVRVCERERVCVGERETYREQEREIGRECLREENRGRPASRSRHAR